MEDTTIKSGKKTFVSKFNCSFFNKYEILGQLGKGGYSKVFKVKNKKSGAIRACKQLSKLRIKNLERFRREINILINVDHPNIVKLYEIFELKHSFYLIMEECKGGEIFDKIIDHIHNKKMYSEKHAVKILQQIISAIEYCHNNGICHRDLKPENILYLNEGSEENNPIKIIDFGLSHGIIPFKRLKSLVGTKYYIAPEILKGSYTEKCDIWSAGVILYIILSGNHPFDGENIDEIYNKISKIKFNFPDKYWKNISNEAKDLICHMISPENERFSAKQVLEHPWFKNVGENNLVDLHFNPIFFKEYAKMTFIKKITLFFIASRLEENEINNLKKTFEAFNTKKDGQISYEEFKKGLMELKSNNINENEIYKLFNSIDADKNGKIDYTEFLASTLQKQNYLKKERLYEAFCMFDKDNSGNISKNELIEVLKLNKNQEMEIIKIIDEVDKDGDGTIDYKEFLELMGYDEK